MVRVPLPQEQLRSGVSSGFSPQRVVGPADFTGQQIERFGQGLLRAGAATTEIALQLQNDLDDAKTKEADNRLAELEQVATRDFMSRIGKEANPSARDEVIGGLQERIDLLGQGLDNDVQRSMFQQVAQARLRRARDRIDSHSIAETRKWNIGETDQHRRGFASDAVDAWLMDPGGEDYTASVIRAVREARTQANLLGLPEDSEQSKALVRETTTDIHSGIIRQLVQGGRGTEARKYLASVPKKDLDPDVRFQLQGVVQRASVAEEGAGLAIRVRDQILTEHRQKLVDPGRTQPMAAVPSADSIVADGLQRIQAQFEAGEISLEVRDSAFGELQTLGKIRKAEEIEVLTETREAAEQWLIENPLASVQALPPALYTDVVGHGLLDDLIAFAESGRRYPNSPTYFSGLFTQEGRLRMAQMGAKEFFEEARTKLNDEFLRKALALYADVHDRASVKDFKLLQDLKRVEMFADRLKIEKDDPRFEQLIKEVEKRGKALGRDVTSSDIDQILGDLLEETVIVLPEPSLVESLVGDPFEDRFTRGRFGRVDLPLSLLTAEERERAAVVTPQEGEIVRLAEVPGPRPDVPASLQQLSVREYLIGRLNLAEEPVSERAIVELWVESGKPGAVDASWPEYKKVLALFSRGR